MKMIITITIAAMIAVFVLPNVLAAVVKVYPIPFRKYLPVH